MFRLLTAVFFVDVVGGPFSPALDCLRTCMGFEKSGTSTDFVAVYDDWPIPRCEWWSEATACTWNKCSQDDKIVKWVVEMDLPGVVLNPCADGTAAGFFDSLFKYIKAVKAAVPTSECAGIEIRNNADFCDFYMCIWGKILVPMREHELTKATFFVGQVLKMTYAFNQNGRWVEYPTPQKCVDWVTDMHIDDTFGQGEIEN